MGSTDQSAQATKSTFAGFTSGVTETMNAVTSSGLYIDVGDVSQIIVRVLNASSSAAGAVFVEPGSAWAASRGQDPSTTSTLYSTATAPIAIAVVASSCDGSSAAYACQSRYLYMEAGTVKSSDQKIYIVASTVSTKMYAGVFALPGGSTN
jgi:hypothetical protein